MLKNGLTTFKSQSMEWKHNDSTVKKTFWTQLSVKKIMLILFGDILHN